MVLLCVSACMWVQIIFELVYYLKKILDLIYSESFISLLVKDTIKYIKELITKFKYVTVIDKALGGVNCKAVGTVKSPYVLGIIISLDHRCCGSNGTKCWRRATERAPTHLGYVTYDIQNTMKTIILFEIQ